jgi:hypothetical protein
MRADELIATRQVTPAMIGAAHDVKEFWRLGHGKHHRGRGAAVTDALAALQKR